LLDASLINYFLTSGTITQNEISDPDPNGYRVVGEYERLYYYLGTTNPSVVGEITDNANCIPPV